MAEIAAGTIVVEQVLATGVEAAAAVAIARPSLPVQGSLKQIARSAANDSSLALARSHHSVTVIGQRAYIFGGEASNGRLCNADVHAISLAAGTEPAVEYGCYPAIPAAGPLAEAALVPPPRKGHAACARDGCIVIHGGSDAHDGAISEDSCLWLWNTNTAQWTRVKGAKGATETGTACTAMAPRTDHAIFADENDASLLACGGRLDTNQATGQIWKLDLDERSWSQLPSCPTAFLGGSAAFVNGTLYVIASESDMGGEIWSLKLGASAARQHMELDAPSWTKIDYPSHPLIPGPRPRAGSALIPVTTGLGRWYLVYMFGSREQALFKRSEAARDAEHPFYSDIWALQIPSPQFTGASVKDVIRDALPGSIASGKLSWAEVEIVPQEEVDRGGKAHPGPRGFFGASSCLGGKGVILWGGVDGGNRKASDGWVLKIE